MDNRAVFLDANIILDILGINREKHNEAKKLWKILTMQNYKICISEDILTNVYYISKEKVEVLKFFKVIQNRWYIVPFGKSVIDNAIKLSLENNLDLEDTLQCLCAKDNGCKILITNDKKFYECGIEIMSCEEFLNRQINN